MLIVLHITRHRLLKIVMSSILDSTYFCSRIFSSIEALFLPVDEVGEFIFARSKTLPVEVRTYLIFITLNYTLAVYIKLVSAIKLTPIKIIKFIYKWTYM